MDRIEALLRRQNADGGWNYGSGGSCTEPTCFSLLAMHAAGFDRLPEYHRGVAWLQHRQKPDGGWSPRDSVPESTWVTALALLLPANTLTPPQQTKAADWVIGQTGRESGWAHRLRLILMGTRSEQSQEHDGWPWYPGAAAWVTPTALTVLALRKTGRLAPSDAQGKRVLEGQAFLLARQCRDGGWNHGSTRALGYDGASYPETTGVALLALSGRKEPGVIAGLAAAGRHLASCRSSEAASWLTLGLLSHGQRPHPPAIDGRQTTMELALEILASTAEKGRNPFLD
jgi:hypothetical protein